MAIELRVWHTTEGLDLPFYKLPYTRAALYSAIDATFPRTNAQLYQYPNFNTGSLLADPYLRDMRWIARQAFQGWNALAVAAPAPAGSFRFLTTGGTGATIFSHSPGASSWDTVGSLDRLVFSGGSLPPWMGGGAAQVRPFPNEYFGWGGSGGGTLPTVYAQTSDNRLVRLTFASNFNQYGWQSWYVSRSDGAESLFPNPADMLSTLVKSSDDPEPEMARFNPRTATSTIGCYIMSKADVGEFLDELWTGDIIDTFQRGVYGDGADAILGLKWFYGIQDQLTTAGTSYITLGNLGFTGIPKQQVARYEFVGFDAGSVVVPQYYGDFRDWTATTYRAYLPFVGLIDLQPKDVVGKTLYLVYVINITDGSASCVLSTTPNSPSGTGTIFTTSCSWGYDIPVRAEMMTDLISRTARIAAQGYSPVLGAITGGDSSYSSGELSPNSNVMGDFQPKIIIDRKGDVSGSAFDAAEGQPSGATMTVGSASGYLKVSTVYNAGTLPARHADEIVALLQEGIYI